MLAPLTLDSCDPGIEAKALECRGDLGDRVAGTVEEMGRAGAVAAPEPGGGGSGDGAGKIALAVPGGRSGDDGHRDEVRIEEEVVDMPPGRAVTMAGEAQVPLYPSKAAAPVGGTHVDVPALRKLPRPESADTGLPVRVPENEGVNAFIHRTGAPPGRP